MLCLCMSQQEMRVISFADFSFKNWKNALPDNPGEVLLSATSDQLMEYLGIAGYLQKEQCSVTPTASTLRGWNDGEWPKTYNQKDLIQLLY